MKRKKRKYNVDNVYKPTKEELRKVKEYWQKVKENEKNKSQL